MRAALAMLLLVACAQASAQAQRIVSLAPHITELLFAAGAGAKVVAVSEYSDYPEEAKRLPRVASSAGIDLERVLALRADLAVAWRLEATARSLDRLAALGVPVHYIEPHRLSEIPDAIETLGKLAGTEPVARPAAEALRKDLADLRAKYASRRNLRVFYQVSERPLMTINGRQFLTDALATCGATNVFADAPVIAPVVSPESVLAADPDVIVAGSTAAADEAWQQAWRRFPGMRAVRDGNLVTVAVDDMHRHGPRAFPAARRLCEQLERARARSPSTAPSPR